MWRSGAARQVARLLPAGHGIASVGAPLAGNSVWRHSRYAQDAGASAVRLARNWQPAPAAQQPVTQRISCPTASTDAAVLVFVPLSARDACSLAAWQGLGSVIEPRFFQRYRVERNLGYVVSARFHCTANQPGMLFALQSPAFAVDQLEAAISDFLAELRDDDGLFANDAASFAAPHNRFNAPLTAAQRLAHWHQQQAHAPFSGVLTRDDLRAACQQLCHAATPRITLHNRRS